MQTVKHNQDQKRKKELKFVLMFTNWYLNNYAEIHDSLYQLRREKSEFVWTDEQENGFEELKMALKHSVVLAYADIEATCVLDTDASDKTTGAALNQLQDGKERRKRFKKISYTSSKEILHNSKGVISYCHFHRAIYVLSSM